MLTSCDAVEHNKIKSDEAKAGLAKDRFSKFQIIHKILSGNLEKTGFAGKMDKFFRKKGWFNVMTRKESLDFQKDMMRDKNAVTIKASAIMQIGKTLSTMPKEFRQMMEGIIDSRILPAISSTAGIKENSEKAWNRVKAGIHPETGKKLTAEEKQELYSRFHFLSPVVFDPEVSLEKRYNPVTNSIPVDMLQLPLSIVRTIHKEVKKNRNMIWNDGKKTFKTKFMETFLTKHTLSEQDASGILYKVNKAMRDKAERIEQQSSKYTLREDKNLKRLADMVNLDSTLPTELTTKQKQSVFETLSNRLLSGEFKVSGIIRVAETEIAFNNFQEYMEIMQNKQSELTREHTSIQNIEFKKRHFNSKTMAYSDEYINEKGEVEQRPLEQAYYKMTDLPTNEKRDDYRGKDGDSNIMIQMSEKMGALLLRKSMVTRELYDEHYKEQSTSKRTMLQKARYDKILPDLQKAVKVGLITEETYQYLTEEMNLNFKLLQHNTDNKDDIAERQEDYIPRIYHPGMLEMQYQAIMKELTEEINRYKAMQEEDKLDYSSEIAKFEKAKKKISEKFDLVADLNEEGNIFQSITPIAVANHLKEVSGELDVTLSRMDRGIFHDSIRRTYTKFERNEAVLTVAEALMHPNVVGNAQMKDYMIDGMLKVSLRTHDIPTRLVMKDISVTKSRSFLNNKLGLNITDQQFSKFIRKFNAYIGGNLLKGQDTAIGNHAPIIQKLGSFGMRTLVNSWQEYRADEEGWKQRAREAGVLGFKSHFADFMEKDMSKETDDTMRRAKRVFMEKVMGEPAFADKNQYKEFAKSFFSDYAPNIADKMLHFALGDKVFGAVRGMSTTEETIRTMTYIMGASKAAQISGLSIDDPAVKEIAKNIVFYQDFILSEQDFPMLAQGEIGNFLTKLKPYQMNKFEFDAKVIKRAWDSTSDKTIMTGMTEKEKEGLSFNGLSKIAHIGEFAKELLNLNTMFSQKGRQSNPMMAEMQNLAFVSGFITYVIDFVLFAPGAGYMLNKAFGKLPYMSVATRATSPLLSLGMFLTGHIVKNLIPGGDDDWFDDEEFLTLLNFTPIGIIPMAMVQLFFGVTEDLLDIDQDEPQGFMGKHYQNALAPLVPFGNWGVAAITGVGGYGKEKLEEWGVLDDE